MQAPRPFIPAVLLVVAMVVVPLTGVALANAVRPVIPAEPAAPFDPIANIPAMPDRPATVRPLSTWFENLPIVDPGSDATPRPFVARYRGLPVGDQRAAAGLIDVAFGEIRVGRSARAVTKDFLDALTVAAVEPDDPGVDFDDESDVPGAFDTPAFRSLSERAMKGIKATPSNAQGLNDLAVAIATTALASPDFLPSGSDTGRPIASSTQLREAAIRLLELGRASFPTDRAMVINLAYLRSLDGGPEEATDPVSVELSRQTIAALQTHLDGAPIDVTARSLLANLVVRTDLEHGLDRAMEIAQPLIDDPETEPAGRIIRADALVFAADRQRTKSPFTARSTVRDALNDYDRVIELSGDAAAYAGRARALDVLGLREAALEAQGEAVRLTQSSVPWRLRLAQLEGCLGQIAGWRRDAQDAFETAVKAKVTPLLATRYIQPEVPGRGYGEYSIGSDLPTWDVTRDLALTGVTITALDPFPEPAACMSNGPDVATATDDVAIEVALAALADDDLAAAQAALEAWRKQLPQVDEEDREPAMPDAAALVLGLLAGGQPTEEDDSIGTFLPLASRLPPDVQGRICRMLSGVVGLSHIDVDALVVCTAEAAERTSDHAAAAQAIEPAVRLDDRLNAMKGSTALQAGMLSELTGRLDIARARYEAAATYVDTAIAGFTRLGDLDLRESDASGALDHYALAEAAIRTQSNRADDAKIDDALAERIGQYLDNNRGIALLMTARTETDAPPDCAAFDAICQQAGDAFAAAMAADPMNPVYPMNAAWVARLTGDADRATALLTEALAEGTPLVAAAHNDLGVLAAQRGELSDARAHFVQAIAIEPEYDLATWNLGVLDSRQAGLLIVAGQALLAEATDLNRDLLTKELTFLADERVYRVEVSGVKLELARAPGTGAAVGAAAFGAIATVGAIAQLLSGLGGDVQDAAGTVAGEGLGRAGRRLRGIGGRLGGGERRRPSWLAWIPAIVVLTVTTAWTAAWMAPDAFVTAVMIGLVAASLSLVVHACGHLVVAGRFGASLQASGWTPGIALAIVGMPFHIPAGPFLAEQITTGDPRRDWWVSFAGVVANLAAAGIALLIYLAAPMPFLRILIATQLAVAAFALIPSHPLDGERLATRPIMLALMGLCVVAASTAIAVGAL